MAILVRCSGCGKAYDVPVGVLGRKVPCKKCGALLDLEQPPANVVPPPAPAAPIWSFGSHPPLTQPAEEAATGSASGVGLHSPILLGLTTLAVALVIVVGVLAYPRQETIPPALDPAQQVVARRPVVPSAATPQKLTTQDLVRKILPSVVTIVGDEGFGSGFVIDSGLIATNLHVIDGTHRATVFTNDGREFHVEGFVAADRSCDLAVVYVRADLPALPIAAAEPERGEAVYAFGAPRGLAGSVTDGIVSAVRFGSALSASDTVVTGEDSYTQRGLSPRTRWIQASTAITQGNSGGPLVNASGEVVGVNCLGLKSQNLYFCVSASHITSLIASGHSVRPLSKLPRKPAVVGDEVAVQPRVEVELELGRLNDRIVQVRKEIALIEVEGGQLTQQLTDILAQIQAAEVRATHVAAGVAAARQRLTAIDTSIHAATYVGNLKAIPALRSERLIIETRGNSLLQEGAEIQAVSSALNLKADNIKLQLQYKGNQRDMRVAEQALLLKQYEDLRQAR